MTVAVTQFALGRKHLGSAAVSRIPRQDNVQPAPCFRDSALFCDRIQRLWYFELDRQIDYCPRPFCLNGSLSGGPLTRHIRLALLWGRSTLNLFAERNTNCVLFGYRFLTSWFQCVFRAATHNHAKTGASRMMKSEPSSAPARKRNNQYEETERGKHQPGRELSGAPLVVGS